MSAQVAFRPHPEKRSASEGGTRAVSAGRVPTQNCILAALPADDRERLLPALECVPLPSGLTLLGAGEPERYLYFLTDGVVSRYYLTENGAAAEYGLAGREGVIGIASFLGGESTPNRALVLSAGHAYRLAARLVQKEFQRYGSLARHLLRYTQALVTQTGQIAACNRHHSVEQQLCRWILSYLDRMPSNELKVTQELIANMLGVRREGVTEAAVKLQRAGLIHYTRGRIEVLDRPGLEARVCECYWVVKREYERLLRPENPARPAGGRATWRPAGNANPPCFGH
jgi:CRP-like cAMP-binding protein